ncbi:GGDEF domain-containing protein [Halopseudomonas maritima]|uniref:GGDEF domain-containing protein n=1 Tax=Halopseudomonas maritima TaxID=2918528 RepID=UPI001EEB1F5D|nr:GGDEF domain-containing protein [Halopseudomonas maritima]UJJ31652.1 GGDEF domain-containing protein [Halopseudomonas maritima]
MLDMTTLMLVLALTTATAVVCLLVAAALNPQVPAMRFWATGLTVVVAGALLQAVREQLPLWISAVALTQGYFLLWWGARSYRHGGSPEGLWRAMLLFLLAQGLAFFILRDSLRFSIMTHSAIVVVVSVLMAAELVRVKASQRTLTLAWCFIWGLHAALYARRFVLYMLDPVYIQAVTFEQAEPVEVLTYLEGIVFIYAFSMLCIMFLLRRLQEELKQQATHDPLTNLLNRRAFEEAAHRQLAANRRLGHEGGLMLLDLDRFKSINDTWGHQVGDRVLAAFARLLNRQLREQDLACRFGGEEFLLLVSGVNQQQLAAMAQRLREQWQATEIRVGDGTLSTTVSIGFTMVGPAPLHLLVEQADQALYRAKESGRNCAHAWEASPLAQ